MQSILQGDGAARGSHLQSHPASPFNSSSPFENSVRPERRRESAEVEGSGVRAFRLRLLRKRSLS